MQSSFVIYNHTSNSWFLEWGNWHSEYDLRIIPSPTNYHLHDVVNSDGDKVSMLTPMDVRNVMTQGPEPLYPYNIKKFDTISDAEMYINSHFSSTGNEFYTIRKIYY